MRQRRSIFRFDPSGGPVINTTPLIDVMLVMLVMFVITIPPPTHMVDVILPADAPIAIPVRASNHITIDPESVVRWNGDAVDLGELGQLVKSATGRDEPAAILLEPDAQARYLRVDQVIGTIRSHGGEKLAFPGIHHYRDLI